MKEFSGAYSLRRDLYVAVFRDIEPRLVTKIFDEIFRSLMDFDEIYILITAELDENLVI